MGARSEARGTQYGNTRGKERQKRRTDLRAKNPRVSSALAEVRSHQERIDSLLAKRSEATPGSQGRLVYSLVEERRLQLASTSKTSVATVTPIKDHKKPTLKAPSTHIDIWGSGNGNWSLQDATTMLVEGYTLYKVMHTTGWGAFYFLDLIDYLDDDPTAQGQLRRIKWQLEEQEAKGGGELG